MRTIQDRLQDFLTSLKNKLVEKGFPEVDVKAQWSMDDGIDIMFVQGNRGLDKYTLYEDDCGVWFIRTIFV